MSVDPIFALALRWLLALLFAAAAVHKISDLTAFRIVLHDYEVLPGVLVTPATALVIATELLLAATLPWRALTSLASLVALSLLATYSLAIEINLLRGRRYLECGCAPSAYRQPLSEWLLVRNFGLMLAAMALRLPIEDRSLEWLDGFTLAGLVVAGAAAWVAAQQLLSSRERLTPLRSPA